MRPLPFERVQHALQLGRVNGLGEVQVKPRLLAVTPVLLLDGLCSLGIQCVCIQKQ
jgi:hypothetical protein